MAAAALRRSLALAALLWALPATGDDLGTLFHTPEQRARLEQLRRGEPASGPVSPAHAPKVTGFVKRSDGRSTVWIDGLAVPIASPLAERILETGAVRDYSDRDDEQLRVERKKSP